MRSFYTLFFLLFVLKSVEGAWKWPWKKDIVIKPKCHTNETIHYKYSSAIQLSSSTTPVSSDNEVMEINTSTQSSNQTTYFSADLYVSCLEDIVLDNVQGQIFDLTVRNVTVSDGIAHKAATHLDTLFQTIPFRFVRQHDGKISGVSYPDSMLPSSNFSQIINVLLPIAESFQVNLDFSRDASSTPIADAEPNVETVVEESMMGKHKTTYQAFEDHDEGVYVEAFFNTRDFEPSRFVDEFGENDVSITSRSKYVLGHDGMILKMDDKMNLQFKEGFDVVKSHGNRKQKRSMQPGRLGHGLIIGGKAEMKFVRRIPRISMLQGLVIRTKKDLQPLRSIVMTSQRLKQNDSSIGSQMEALLEKIRRVYSSKSREQHRRLFRRMDTTEIEDAVDSSTQRTESGPSSSTPNVVQPIITRPSVFGIGKHPSMSSPSGSDTGRTATSGSPFGQSPDDRGFAHSSFGHSPRGEKKTDSRTNLHTNPTRVQKKLQPLVNLMKTNPVEAVPKVIEAIERNPTSQDVLKLLILLSQSKTEAGQMYILKLLNRVSNHSPTNDISPEHIVHALSFMTKPADEVTKGLDDLLTTIVKDVNDELKRSDTSGEVRIDEEDLKLKEKLIEELGRLLQRTVLLPQHRPSTLTGSSSPSAVGQTGNLGPSTSASIDSAMKNLSLGPSSSVTEVFGTGKPPRDSVGGTEVDVHGKPADRPGIFGTGKPTRASSGEGAGKDVQGKPADRPGIFGTGKPTKASEEQEYNEKPEDRPGVFGTGKPTRQRSPVSEMKLASVPEVQMFKAMMEKDKDLATVNLISAIEKNPKGQEARQFLDILADVNTEEAQMFFFNAVFDLFEEKATIKALDTEMLLEGLAKIARPQTLFLEKLSQLLLDVKRETGVRKNMQRNERVRQNKLVMQIDGIYKTLVSRSNEVAAGPSSSTHARRLRKRGLASIVTDYANMRDRAPFTTLASHVKSKDFLVQRAAIFGLRGLTKDAPEFEVGLKALYSVFVIDEDSDEHMNILIQALETLVAIVSNPQNRNLGNKVSPTLVQLDALVMQMYNEFLDDMDKDDEELSELYELFERYANARGFALGDIDREMNSNGRHFTKREMIWNNTNPVFGLVASRAARTRDLEKFPRNKVLIYGKKIGIPDFNLQVAVGSFNGLTKKGCFQRAFKNYIRTKARYSLFGDLNDLFAFEMYAQLDDDKLKSRLYLEFDGQILENRRLDVRCVNDSKPDKVYSARPSTGPITLSRVFPVYVAMVKFDFVVEAGVNVDADYRICSFAPSGEMKADVKVWAKANGAVTSNVLEMARGGIRFDASLNYKVGPRAEVGRAMHYSPDGNENSYHSSENSDDDQCQVCASLNSGWDKQEINLQGWFQLNKFWRGSHGRGVTAFIDSEDVDEGIDDTIGKTHTKLRKREWMDPREKAVISWNVGERAMKPFKSIPEQCVVWDTSDETISSSQEKKLAKLNVDPMEINLPSSPPTDATQLSTTNSFPVSDSMYQKPENRLIKLRTVRIRGSRSY